MTTSAISEIPVLTYHSQNVGGNEYGANDHVALEADLRTIAELGLNILSLRAVAEWNRGYNRGESVRNAVAISFDDGTNFDVQDLDVPEHGLQTSFAKILTEHAANANVSVHATCFVIASPTARAEMDAACLFGNSQISDDWWASADESGILAVENHGWDHNHPAVSHVVQRNQERGGFRAVDTQEECDHHVVRAGDYIADQTRRRPMLFAYPFGESSDFIRKRYLPQQQARHGLLAAFSTAGEAVTRDHDPWNLPRFVCGDHWKSPDELRTLLARNR